MRTILLATVMAAAFACSGAFAQNTDKQDAQTDPKETKTVPAPDEANARPQDSAKDQSSAAKPEEEMPAQGTANQSSENDTPRQGERIPEKEKQ